MFGNRVVRNGDAAGEHGFSMRQVGTSADHWAEHFVQWLRGVEIAP